jgi:beta-lactamase class A
MDSKTKIIILSAVIFLVGTGIGYGAGYYYNLQQTKSLITNILPVRENNFNYKFIYPLLKYDFGGARYFLEDKNLEQKINSYVQQQYQSKNIESISVYTGNLSTGGWAGVDADTKYVPGSMMKVLIMMAYYRESQLDPSIMDKNLVYSNEVAQLVNKIPYVNPVNLIVGQSYATKYLLEDMIENSDDAADTLLLLNVDQNILNDVFRDLNIEVPGTVANYTISPREYTYFLRILYNSTYLTEDNSEDALSVLSKSTYHEGIYAGVPSGIEVAQKYGESVDIDPQTKNVVATYLNNCGIVYAPKYPYTLCIMTKAKGLTDHKQQASIIKNISAIVYNYISSGVIK